MEGNYARISSAVKWLKCIQEEVLRVPTVFLQDDYETFLEMINKKMQFCITRLHLATNLLNPRF